LFPSVFLAIKKFFLFLSPYVLPCFPSSFTVKFVRSLFFLARLQREKKCEKMPRAAKRKLAERNKDPFPVAQSKGGARASRVTSLCGAVAYALVPELTNIVTSYAEDPGAKVRWSKSFVNQTFPNQTSWMLLGCALGSRALFTVESAPDVLNKKLTVRALLLQDLSDSAASVRSWSLENAGWLNFVSLKLTQDEQHILVVTSRVAICLDAKDLHEISRLNAQPNCFYRVVLLGPGRALLGSGSYLAQIWSFLTDSSKHLRWREVVARITPFDEKTVILVLRTTIALYKVDSNDWLRDLPPLRLFCTNGRQIALITHKEELQVWEPDSNPDSNRIKCVISVFCPRSLARASLKEFVMTNEGAILCTSHRFVWLWKQEVGWKEDANRCRWQPRAVAEYKVYGQCAHGLHALDTDTGHFEPAQKLDPAFANISHKNGFLVVHSQRACFLLE
jgi:hypothetical protein